MTEDAFKHLIRENPNPSPTEVSAERNGSLESFVNLPGWQQEDCLLGTQDSGAPMPEKLFHGTSVSNAFASSFSLCSGIAHA
jgi:hypothetical protein